MKDETLIPAKTFSIPKQLFVVAHKHVKANAGACGVDKQSLEDFGKNLRGNLYKLWNRMSSASYFPPAIKAVPIPKKSGGVRILGVPTVGDRVCQMVVKMVFEPMVEPYFLSDSYGYRPNKSALQAVGITRQRCWKYDWVVEFDIKGLFDNIPHELLMKAVRKHTQERWLLFYIERWLKAPMQNQDGTFVERKQGIPQGGVISPVLSNLFLHYVFDMWMGRQHPGVPWCRYADDGLLHVRTKQEAQKMLLSIKERFAACGLELHPEKTKIVYCGDGSRKDPYKETSFDFLGYTFKARICKTKGSNFFMGFNPAVSNTAKKSMQFAIRKMEIAKHTERALVDIAQEYNQVLRGWLNYYGKYTKSAMKPVLRLFNLRLIAWVMRKYKSFRRKRKAAGQFLERILLEKPGLFVHWQEGMGRVFA